MSGRETLGHAGDHGVAALLKLLQNSGHILQWQVRTTRRDQAGILPQRLIMLASVTRIAGGEVKRHITAVGWSGQFEAYLMLRHEWCHRLLPALGSVLFADVSHAREAPQGLLPGLDVCRSECALLKFHAQAVEQQGWFRAGECGAQQGEVSGVQPLCATLALKCGEILCERQAATRVGVEFHALQIHRLSTAGLGEPGIEGTNLCQRLIRPVA